MAKKMTSPEKMPPTQKAENATNSNAPTIQISKSGSSETANIASPTLTPPAQVSQGSAFGAATWYSDKRVNGLYTTFHAHNSWMSISEIGWVMLATNSDSACEAMTILASHARTRGSRIDYSVDEGLVNEMYIW